MNKTIVLFLAVMCSYPVFAQDVDEVKIKSNEVKWNATNLIGFSFLDFSYEYLINEESSFGVGVLFNVGESDALDEYRTFSLTPYYRQYFSKKYARGFFVEGFAMLNSGEDEEYYYSSDEYTSESYTDLALGISIGGKFMTKRGFVTEIYLGIGRNLLDTADYTEVVGRGGVSLGYRF